MVHELYPRVAVITTKPLSLQAGTVMSVSVTTRQQSLQSDRSGGPGR